MAGNGSDQMLNGLMQDDFPLTVQHIRRRMVTCSPQAEVVTLTAPETVQRTSYAELGGRIDRLARALQKIGVEQGDRVATFAWNNQPHFDMYFAIPCVGAVVPMFHANAWGLPHGAALAGADLILPDRYLQAEPLAKLITAERPTLMGCVPTIFSDLLRYADEHPEVDLSSLTNAACGGSAVPRQLMKDFEERHGVRMFQAWGMTETSPVATYSRPLEGEHGDAYWDERARQGRALPWVELRLGDDDGRAATGVD